MVVSDRSGGGPPEDPDEPVPVANLIDLTCDDASLPSTSAPHTNGFALQLRLTLSLSLSVSSFSLLRLSRDRSELFTGERGKRFVVMVLEGARCEERRGVGGGTREFP